jgi:hypothetical protein
MDAHSDQTARLINIMIAATNANLAKLEPSIMLKPEHVLQINKTPIAHVTKNTTLHREHV